MGKSLLFLLLSLGAAIAGLEASAQDNAPASLATVDKPQTIIDSDRIDMDAADTKNTFVFSGNVRAEGQGLLLTCDKLKVTALRSGKSEKTVGEMNGVERVIATGNVRIEQAGRVAEAGKAEVDPTNGIVTLSESPRIIDTKAVTYGWKIIYNSRDKSVSILNDPSGQSVKSRPRVVLSENAIPQLNYEKVLQPEENDDSAKPEADTTSESPSSQIAPEDDNTEEGTAK